MKISENLSNLKNVIDKAAKNDLDASATGSFLQNFCHHFCGFIISFIHFFIYF